MPQGPKFKVIQAPTSKNWKIIRDGDELPLLFTDSKEDAMSQARKMAQEQGGAVESGSSESAKPKKTDRAKKAVRKGAA